MLLVINRYSDLHEEILLGSLPVRGGLRRRPGGSSRCLLLAALRCVAVDLGHTRWSCSPNTARAHQLDKAHGWVVVYFHSDCGGDAQLPGCRGKADDAIPSGAAAFVGNSSMTLKTSPHLSSRWTPEHQQLVGLRLKNIMRVNIEASRQQLADRDSLVVIVEPSAARSCVWLNMRQADSAR